MSPLEPSGAASTRLPYRVLVLDDDEHALSGMVELLHEASYFVTGASTYDAAKELLGTSPWDLLISDVRLRGYNGLHLVRQVHAEHPEMAVIIMTGYEDPMIQLEAGRYGADFMQKPITPSLFLGAVSRALSRIRRERRWPRKQVAGGFRVTAAGRPAAVVDVGYGGLRLRVPAGVPLPSRFDVEVSGIGLHLQVEPVWWSNDAGSTLCGAALSSDSSAAAQTWRTIVDRLG